MIATHSRDIYEPTSKIRWDRDMFNGSHDSKEHKHTQNLLY